MSIRGTTIPFLIGMIATLAAACFVVADSPLVPLETQFRRPTAIAFAHDKKNLVIVNDESGSASLLDLKTNTVVSETRLGQRLKGLVSLESDNEFATLDYQQGEWITFEIRDRQIVERSRVATVNSPVALAYSEAGKRLAVTGLWGRQVAVHAVSGVEGAVDPTAKLVNVSFCPGHVCWLDADHLIVLDKFSSGVALIDCEVEPTILAEFRLAGRRFGGLHLSDDGNWLTISTQRLNPIGRANRNDVHWGLMIANEVIWLPVSKVIQARGTAEDFEDSIWEDMVIRQVGRAGAGKGDLGAIAESQDNESLVVVEGTDELAVMRRSDLGFGYIPVGQRPLAVVANGTLAYIANSLDDTVSVVDLYSMTTMATITLGPMPEQTPIRAGERLFTHAGLSHDGWFSCHSCHVDGHTNSQLNDGFSDNSFDTPKLVMTLLGRAGTEPFAWDGSSPDLATQIRRSIQSTLQSDQEIDDEQVTSMAAFISSLKSPPSVTASRGFMTEVGRKNHERQFVKGKALFHELGCAECHAGSKYTSSKLFDVGLRDELGIAKFNPPSLVGLGQRDRFFHDGRTDELRKVFTKIRHQLPKVLTDEELSNLLVFLKTL